MRRPSLATFLTLFALATVLGTTVGVGAAGVALIRELAAENATARVRLAATGALQAIERDGGRLLSAALLLAERPTLSGLLRGADARALGDYLAAFQRTSGLAGCAAVAGGKLAATSGPLPWAELERDPEAEHGWSLRAAPDRQPLVLTAAAGVPGVAGAHVHTARVLDVHYARETGAKVGLEVEIFTSWPEDLPAPLRARALAGDEAAAARLEEPGSFFAVLPLRDRDGAVIGGLAAILPAAVVDASVNAFVGKLLLSAATIAVVAALLGLALARRVARPVGALTAAAARIGLGDLSSPVPRVGGRETGTLAATMEEMRRRILHLTTELERRKAEAEATLSGIAEGVFAVDRERRLRYLNRQAAELLGVDPQDVVGRFCGDVLRPLGSGGARPCDAACPILHARFRDGARATEHLLLAGGERRSVVITSAARPEADDPAGASLQYQVMRDETTVEASHRLRDAVLANISHELRSPLSAQLASIELLRDQLPELGRDEVASLVRSLERGTLRLTRLIDNLLESTRIEAGQDALRRRKVALDQVVEEAVELMAPLIEQRRQRLEVALPHPLPPILGDGPRLVQVFVNLLANANKFAPSGTTLRIGGEVGEHEVRLWVADEGPGLPAGAGEKLFERFVRSAACEPEQGGIGLGLWIVKSVVDRHGGRVEVASGAGGTRMTVILPSRSGDENPGG